MKTIFDRILAWAGRSRKAFRQRTVQKDNAAPTAAANAEVAVTATAEVTAAATAEMTAAISALTSALAELRAELAEVKAELAVVRAEQAAAKAAQAANSDTHAGDVTAAAEPDAPSVRLESPSERQQAPSTSQQASGSEPAAPSAKQKSSPSSDRSAVIRFNKQFLSTRYDLRYNVLKRATEFRPKSPAALPACTASGGFAAGTPACTASGGSAAGNTPAGPPAPFQPLTDRDLNRLTVEQLEAGGGSWSYAMRLCIESSAVPSYNPVTSWLGGLPAWDGHDHIGDLARRVPTAYARWPEFFHRWMLAMVAQAAAGEPGLRYQGKGFRLQHSGSVSHGNSMVPLLIGGQGLRKTTFCRSLLPPELREYFMDDIKMDSAEQVERVLARMWLVCVDEYDAKTPREQAKIKRLLTEKDVQVRRPRSDEYRLVPRLASFIATTNDPAPLPSGDGTRRYLCVEVEGQIDLSGDIDYPQLYAQALAELQQEGCRWWFDAADEAEIQRHNAPYQQASPLETVLPSLFEPTTDRRRENLWQVQAVQKVLAGKLRTADIPSLRQLADAMKALRWPQGAACGTRGYYLKEKE